MKKIENKKTEIEDFDNPGEKLTYSDLIGISLNNPVEGGYSVDEMESRLRIKASTTPKAKDKFELERADMEKLKEVVKISKWNILHDDIIAFKNYIAGIK